MNPGRNTPHRIAAAAVVVALLGGGLAACGSGTGSDAGGELTYWSMWKEDEPQQKVIADSIDQFTKDTGIKVRVEWAGRDVVKKKLPAALNTNHVPDLVDQASDEIKPYLADQKQARGLDDVYAAAIPGEPGIKVGDVVPTKYIDSLGLKLPDGQPFMVPYSITGVGFFYDAAALPDVAANPPKTWDAFRAELDKIKAEGKMAPLTNDADQTWANSYWMTYLLNREFGPGGLKKIAADKTGAAWKDPKVLDAAQKLEKLTRGGYLLKGYDASRYPEQQKQWSNNKAAFFLGGSWLPTETQTYAKPGIQYASLPFPTFEGQAKSEEIALFGFAIPAKAKHSAEAGKFIAYFLNKSRAGRIASEAQTLSSRPDVDAPPALAGLKKEIDSVATVHPFCDGADFPGFQDRIYFPAVTDLLLGKTSAQQFVDNIAKAQADFWKSQS
ncbi:ABC transporter substrate-binding protein [Kitasatospora herbaricolor]|uniref:ABC transporter substrate-binding protein n=1 Tax=Kitasatospora herbaricolor TaxID=68217 RepID=UPI0036DDBA23